jgi:LmbE family N-acetylglucosaminyl deacetylase
MAKQDGQRVLAVMAHPGDAAVLCAGTLARFGEQGAKIAWACVADGAGGNQLITTPVAKLGAMRKGHEQIAARIIGADLHWLGLPDGMLFRTDDYVLNLVDVIREVQPTLIITHHPDDYHSDNQYVSKAVFIAANIAPVFNIKTIRPPTSLRPALFYTESWISRAFVPTDYVDITAAYAQKKKAVAANKIGVAWLRDFDKMSIFDLVESNARARGLQSGCKYAEAFRTDPHWPNSSTRRLLP